MQKPNQKEFRVEKVIRRKGDELYVKWKGYGDSLNIWIDERTYSINEWMSEFSPKPKSIGGTVKVELYLSYYVTKTYLKSNICWYI